MCSTVIFYKNIIKTASEYIYIDVCVRVCVCVCGYLSKDTKDIKLVSL